LFRLVSFTVPFFVLCNKYNIEAVMHWCFDCTNKWHSNYFIYRVMPPIGHMDWIGLDLENWTHVQLCDRDVLGVVTPRQACSGPSVSW